MRVAVWKTGALERRNSNPWKSKTVEKGGFRRGNLNKDTRVKVRENYLIWDGKLYKTRGFKHGEPWKTRDMFPEKTLGI